MKKTVDQILDEMTKRLNELQSIAEDTEDAPEIILELFELVHELRDHAKIPSRR